MRNRNRQKNSENNKQFNKRIWKNSVFVMTCLVLFCTVYALILAAITEEQELFCGFEEHVHSDECSNENQACPLQEHTHTLQSFSNKDADVETPEIWEKTIPVKTNIVSDDIIAIAQSQLGYKESEDNYLVVDENKIKGYSRYGEWAGDPYGDWNIYFTEYVLNYAGIQQKKYIDAKQMMDSFESEQRLLRPDVKTVDTGSIVFFENEETIMSGIVTNLDEEGIVTIIAGDCNDQVRTLTKYI